MKVNWRAQTGWPKNVLPNLGEFLQSYAHNSASLKVGVTADCEQRSRQYQALERGRYTEMVVVDQISESWNRFYVYIVRRPKATSRIRGKARQGTGRLTR